MVERRHLLTPEEIEMLKSRPASKWYQCACWAVELVGNEVRAKRLDPSLALAIDRTICEWRQNQTLPPLYQQTPIPYAYYHLMVFELVVFETLLAIFMVATVLEASEEPRVISACVLYGLVTLIVEAMLQVAISLSEPWGTQVDSLPAEEFLLLPWLSHRFLYSSGRTLLESVEKDGVISFQKRTAPDSDHMFLRPLEQEDQEYVRQVQFKSGWVSMKKIGAKKFRGLDNIEDAIGTHGLVDGFTKTTSDATRRAWESTSRLVDTTVWDKIPVSPRQAAAPVTPLGGLMGRCRPDT